ncbi:MAG: PorV/PorQ family protein, partial [Elusimicrobiaceae bacterium]
ATGDASVIFYNPAALGWQKEGSAIFTHSVWFESVNYDIAAVAVPVSDNIGVVGAGLQMLSYGSIDSWNNTGVSDGSFSPKDYVGMLSWGRKFHEKFSGGAQVKFISSKITQTASTLAADLGVRGQLTEELGLGFSAQNLGGKLKYINESESLPSIYRLGAEYQIKHTASVYADCNTPTDGKVWFSLGGEYNHSFMDEKLRTALRAGYTTRLSDARNDSTFPVSFGFGIGYSQFGLDYAFAPYGDLGATHHIGLKYSWGEKK